MTYISGIRPSGRLHLGNYIGSILPALRYDADVLVAQFQAPAGDWLSLHKELAGIFNQDKIRLQEYCFNGKLYFKLLQATPTGLLKHMPQYKEKDKNALMFCYPVLMAHDIVGYDYVIVGEDQRPHIEFAKDILHKIDYKCPEPIYEGGKVMDLRHPTQKMSKSNPESCLFMSDSPGIIRLKIKKANTNIPGINNLVFIANSLGVNIYQGSNEIFKTRLADELIRRFSAYHS